MKLNFKNEKVWVTSDTHYSHKNICRGTTDWRLSDGSVPQENTRDFVDLNHMNFTIVNNINEKVKENDFLIFLGDWSFGGFENIIKFRSQIICNNIHFILGNHDHHIENNKDNVKELFLSVSNYCSLSYKEIKFKLMHFPISSWDGLDRGTIHLHGHMHFKNEHRFGVGRSMDVGLDGNSDFKPYNIEECIELMENKPINSIYLNDHHLDGL